MEPKTPKQSRVEMTEIVLPTHTNRFGTVFGGQITAWIDIAGGVAAMRHAGSLAVTASMDQLHFLHGAKTGDIVVLRAQVNYAGRTSMEVGVRVDSENPITGEQHHTATAYLTFVAVDEEGQPRAVPALEPITEDERRRHEKARRRREQRLADRREAVERARRKGDV
ncbi:MAG: acyl-CoA thioesterase [Deltaproteobacteria bacterium]|nr:acyl-CoA thioesterase [Deltaproteobacteria bacterium]